MLRKLTLGLLLVGCEVAVPSGVFVCSSGLDCPDDQVCSRDEVDGATKHCYHQPPILTGTLDAAVMTGATVGIDGAGVAPGGGRAIDGGSSFPGFPGGLGVDAAGASGFGGFIGAAQEAGVIARSSDGGITFTPSAVCTFSPQLCSDGSVSPPLGFPGGATGSVGGGATVDAGAGGLLGAGFLGGLGGGTTVNAGAGGPFIGGTTVDAGAGAAGVPGAGFGGDIAGLAGLLGGGAMMGAGGTCL